MIKSYAAWVCQIRTAKLISVLQETVTIEFDNGRY